MNLHEGFEEKGFLSAGSANGIASLRAENADWFKLADDMNEVLMRSATAAMETVKTSSMAPEAVAVRVLQRSCGSFQAVILLTERGMVAEGRSLARSLIENAFGIAALHDNPAEFMKLLKEDSEASRKRQANFILAEDLIATGSSRSKLQDTVDAIGKPSPMNIKSLATLGPLTKLYLSYQRLSDDATHLSARSLNRHIWTDPTRSGWNYKWGPGSQGENAATLYHAFLAAISIGVGVTQMLKDMANNEKFGELANRFHAMPLVPTV